jgi:hypothetical protein
MLEKEELKKWIKDALLAVECGAPSREFIDKLDGILGIYSHTSGVVISINELGPHGKPVVAKIGYCDDFAAYEQASKDQRTSDDIARWGDKLSKQDAMSLFPELFMRGLSYRE